MAKFKGVEGGTPTGPALCRTCSYAMYVQGKAASSLRLYCRVISNRDGIVEMKTEAYECSEYEDKRLPSRHAMEKTAWILRTDEFRKSIGFVSPADWKKIRREIHPDEPYED